ncbi:MAG: hypothetical protein NWE76_02460, partial [Candidatus Bathyarchaeota archaeon]|nr:hypothetical protein [Candidatus Bathyarchaeota archaeon]
LPGDIKSEELREWILELEEIATVVNHVYLIVFKEPMGLPSRVGQSLRRESRLARDIGLIKAIYKYGSRELRRKLIVDGCLQAVLDHNRTGNTCSSNVSRFALWPNGAITGCPYSALRSERSGTVEQVLDRIRKAQKTNDFRDICYLARTYNAIRR